MRMTVVVLLLVFTVNGVVNGQSPPGAPAGSDAHNVFGLFAEQDLDAVAARYTERLASPGILLWSQDEVELEQEDQVPDQAPPDTGGSRFGGPLLWTMIITAATTVGFVYVGIRLSPDESVTPPEG